MNPDHRSLERPSTQRPQGTVEAPESFHGRATQVSGTRHRLTGPWWLHQLQTDPVSPGSGLAPVSLSLQHVQAPAGSRSAGSFLAHHAASFTRGSWPEAGNPGPRPPQPAARRRPTCPQAAQEARPAVSGACRSPAGSFKARLQAHPSACGQLQSLSTNGGKVNWYGHCVKPYSGSSKN